jgi:acetolactate synthase-1/2/3 large subunit
MPSTSTLADALRRALANAPALVDVVTSQVTISSDARKGRGFVPDFQPLTAWDDAERKRRMYRATPVGWVKARGTA